MPDVPKAQSPVRRLSPTGVTGPNTGLGSIRHGTFGIRAIHWVPLCAHVEHEATLMTAISPMKKLQWLVESSVETRES